ncbi:MAG: hypothetical protein ABWZ55_09135 [Acidimicrobiales bacterium]
MDADVKFWFYLAAVVCFVLASVGEAWKFGGRTRRGLKPAIALMPLGLALFVFPTMWDVGVEAF